MNDFVHDFAWVSLWDELNRGHYSKNMFTSNFVDTMNQIAVCKAVLIWTPASNVWEYKIDCFPEASSTQGQLH